MANYVWKIYKTKLYLKHSNLLNGKIKRFFNGKMSQFNCEKLSSKSLMEKCAELH